MCYQLNGFEQIQYHLLGAQGYELLKIMGLKRNVRSFLDFSLHPAARTARIQRSMSLSSHLIFSPGLFLMTLSTHPAAARSADPSPAWKSLPAASHSLWLPPSPTLEAREAAEICLWHWEGGLLMLLPSRRAFMPDLWQLDELSGLAEASLRTGPPSD